MEMISALVIMTLALIGLSYAVYRQQAEIKYMQQEWSRMHNTELGELREDLQALLVGSKSSGARTSQLERASCLITEQLETLQTGQKRERPYGRAIQMVHNGADVRDLVENFSLSSNEAELIVSLHQGAS